MMGERLDIWFTQDAVDGDNLPATKLTGIYAIQMLKKFETVHIWCDVITAKRSLGYPRKLDNVVINGNVYVEQFGNNEYSTAELKEIFEDTKLCQAYDACLLMQLLQSTVSMYINIQVHVILGKIPEIYVLPKSSLNTFLFVDLNKKTCNSLEKILDIQKMLENIEDFDEIYKEMGREPYNNQVELITVKYDKLQDINFNCRRNRFRCYIENQIKKFGVLQDEGFNSDIFCKSVEEVIDVINHVNSDIHVLAFAPLTNVSIFLKELQRKSRVKIVVGDLLTLEPLDNFLSTQWNESLDIKAAVQFFSEIQRWDHSCSYFFTPTQCFKESKSSQFLLQNNISKACELVHASCMLNIDNTNIFLGFQKLWNVFKSKSCENPWLSKGERIFDVLGLLVLLEFNNPGATFKENPYINKFASCEVITQGNGKPLSILMDQGKLQIPDVRSISCISDDVVKAYLTAYNADFDYDKILKVADLMQQYQNNKSNFLLGKLKSEKSLQETAFCAFYVHHYLLVFLLLVILLMFVLLFSYT